MPADDPVDDQLTELRRALDAQVGHARPDAGAVIRRSRTVQQRHRAFVATAAALVTVLGALVWAQGGPGHGESMTPAGTVAPTTPNTRPGGSPDLRVPVDPLVAAPRWRRDHAGKPLFTVSAGFPSYWRLAAVDTFGDRSWADLDAFVPVPPPADASAGARTTFTIAELDTTWVPTGSSPAWVEAPHQLDRHADWGNVVVGPTEQDVRDLVYRTGEWPPPDAGMAAAWRAERLDQVPETVRAKFATLAAGAAEVVPADAEAAARNEPSPYGRAEAIVRWLRNRAPTVVEVELAEPGQPTRPEAATGLPGLLDRRAGSPEQFAKAFVHVARAMGVPARVVVGFTTGDVVDEDGTPWKTYAVSGRHAHSWVEVHTGRFGWVPLDPTPGFEIPTG